MILLGFCVELDVFVPSIGCQILLVLDREQRSPSHLLQSCLSLTLGFPPHRRPGIVNVVMAAAPLLKEHSQALLLTSYLSTAQAKHLYKETAGFHEKLLCMNTHTASVLLG